MVALTSIGPDCVGCENGSPSIRGSAEGTPPGSGDSPKRGSLDGAWSFGAGFRDWETWRVLRLGSPAIGADSWSAYAQCKNEEGNPDTSLCPLQHFDGA